jgi:hypothetical protein
MNDVYIGPWPWLTEVTFLGILLGIALVIRSSRSREWEKVAVGGSTGFLMASLFFGQLHDRMTQGYFLIYAFVMLAIQITLMIKNKSWNPKPPVSPHLRAYNILAFALLGLIVVAVVVDTYLHSR